MNKQSILIIKECENHHHFINQDYCPICNGSPQNTIKYREGDCINCGQLCPIYAYACTDPKPIEHSS